MKILVTLLAVVTALIESPAVYGQGYPGHRFENNDRENQMLNAAARQRFIEFIKAAVVTDPNFSAGASVQVFKEALFKEVGLAISDEDAANGLPIYREELIRHLIKRYDQTGGVGLCPQYLWQM